MTALADHHLVEYPTSRIAPTAELGTPQRWFQDGPHDPSGARPVIGRRCDVGPFCVVGEGAVLGAECILDAYSLVGVGTVVGARVIVTHRGSVYAAARVGDDCVIGGLVGERSVVGDRCRVFGSLVHRQLDPTMPWDSADSAEQSSRLGDDVFVGWGATVTGVRIGSGSYVCAGAIVTRDVPAGTIVTGVNEFHHPDEWAGTLGRSAFFRDQH